MKDLKVYIIGASVLLVFYLVAQYNRPKAISWKETFINTDKNPFGTYVLFNQLQDIFPGAKLQVVRQPIGTVIDGDSLPNSGYLIVCDGFSLSDSTDYRRLKKYISKGNDVFIAAADFGSTLSDSLELETETEAIKNSQTYVNFNTKALGDSTYLVDHQSSNNYFSAFDTLKTKILGKNGYNHTTFLRVNMGKGSLFLNANPRMFANYSILQDQGASYAGKALSYLKPHKALIWDDFYTEGAENHDSSMRVFLSHPPLRWAFYIVFFSLLLFVIYQSKRRQRIIPIIPPVANTTVEFTNIVGQVYYEQRNDDNIAQKKSTYFLEFIRSRYYLQTRVHDAELMQALADKSGVDIYLIKAIFGQITLIEQGHKITPAELITFNQNIEQFYQQSR